MVVDLHIEKIAKGYRSFSPKDSFDYQVNHFVSVLSSNRTKRGLKIDFVHGVGKGVLREELLSTLKSRFPGFECEDAPFSVYGYQGALRITIR
ncbi:MAG: hypothetical protein Q8R90_07350 [Bacteroidales bacterium]|jgi:hypothetical protein|nr:hypothetical protein [Bacteroidales bacterium]